ncbi:unannotated protein [freshwater metagenome]|uniref:Unannotated protein n=1 Tax=freshwater metagenome TaxID=449393 RepID=A0A6J6IZG2_9ZZZZ|nr:hypothetical protein [Actinomycetota bacterium]
MNRNNLVKIGAIVMILSLLLSIFVGAMSVLAAEPVQSTTAAVSAVQQAPNPDIDGDGVINNEDPDLDGDGIDNGVDPDIDGDGFANGEDGNPTSTNEIDSVPPKDARVETTVQWTGGIAVLAVLGWLVALPYIRRRRGTATKR